MVFVTAERDGRWWFLRVDDPRTATQVRRLDHAEDAVRDLVATFLGVPDIALAETQIHVEPEIPELAEVLREAGDAALQAELAQYRASKMRRKAAHALAAAGLTVRDSAVLLGISHQRVAQLLATTGPLREQ